MTLLITESDVRAILSEPDAMGDAIAAMERLFAEQAGGRLTQLPRIELTHPDPPAVDVPARSLRLMPCIAPGLDAACVRVYTTKVVADGIHTPSEVLLLFELDGMTLLAVIEDHSLHTLRTAAPTGVATRYLATPDAPRVAVLGTGRHARGQLAAVASVRRLEDVVVFGRDPERRDDYCREMEAMIEVPVRGLDSAEKAVQGADIVIVATTTTQPALHAEWLQPGTHINSIAPCELDEETVARARTYSAFTRQLVEGSPTWSPIPEMLEAGRLRPGDVTELCQVVAGSASGRDSADDITLFISSGMAGWDVAIATWVEAWARRAGLGTELWDAATGRSVPGLVCPTPSPVPDRSRAVDRSVSVGEHTDG